MKLNSWVPVIMAGLGAMAAQLDPALDARTLAIVMVKGFIGGAVGAYFGNHVSRRRKSANP